MSPRAWHSPALASVMGLALALLLFFGLSGCGDSAPTEPAPLATGSAETQGGSDEAGAVVLVLPLIGPELDLPAPATVRVHITGQLQQRAYYPTDATVSLSLAAPVATFPTTLPAQLGPTPVQVPLGYVVFISLPAGKQTLQAVLRVQMQQPGAGLARALASAQWEVTLP